MLALEPQVRAFCAEVLDPLVGSGSFDFIANLGKFMPMRVIGMLLGIPEQDQEAIRDHLDEGLRLEEGVPNEADVRRRRPSSSCSRTTSPGAPSTPPTT